MSIDTILSLGFATTAAFLLIGISYLYWLRLRIKRSQLAIFSQYKQIYSEYTDVYKLLEEALAKTKQNQIAWGEASLEKELFNKIFQKTACMQDNWLSLSQKINKEDLFGRKTCLVTNEFLELNKTMSKVLSNFYLSEKKDPKELEDDLKTFKHALTELSNSLQ